MKYIISGAVGLLICLIILIGLKEYNGPELVIQTNNIIQYQTNIRYIRVPYSTTKTNIYTNYVYILDELNQYETNIGWISQSNKQIYAGIYTRSWSVPYKIISKDYKHTIGFMIGNGIVIDYSYQLFNRISLRCGALSKNDNTSLMFGSIYKF